MNNTSVDNDNNDNILNNIPDCAKKLHFAKNIFFYPLNFHIANTKKRK